MSFTEKHYRISCSDLVFFVYRESNVRSLGDRKETIPRLDEIFIEML